MKGVNKVFVYGTLKRGFGNNRSMVRAEGEFLENGTINGTMFSLGGYPKVSLIPEHLSNVVKGELFEVDDAGILGALDTLEGYPSFYDRKIVDVTTDDGNVVQAWTYFIDSPNETDGLMSEGVWGGSTYDF